MNRLKVMFFGLLLLASAGLLAQPANNLCTNATSLGTPALNTQVCDAGTTIGATAEYPYPGVSSACIGNPAGTTGPSSDVWYTITTPANTNALDVTLTSTMDTVNVVIYSGNCGSLAAINCGVNASGGNFTGTIPNIFPNQTLYIQVSGGDTLDVSTFNLCVTPTQQAGACALDYSLVATPQPVNGTYTPGQTVQFCYTLDEYSVLAANWFHSVVLDFGAGWDLATLTPISSAATCDGSGGTWGFYNTVLSTNTFNTYGPGFFFDRDNDGNPGNNFGDNCSLGNWTFCWEITVQNLPCNSIPNDLSVNVTPYGDSETGSWSSPACNNDPVGIIASSVSCCTQPLVSTTDVACSGACTGTADVAGTSQPPFTYQWAHGPTDSNLTGLCPGNYTVTVTDFNNCVVIETITIAVQGELIVDIDSSNISCVGAGDGRAWVTPTNGVGPYTYSWASGGTPVGGNTDTISNLQAGTYTVTIEDAAGCLDTNTVQIVEPLNMIVRPNTDSVSCAGASDGSAWVVVAGSNPPFTYAWNTTPVQVNDTITGLTAGQYTVVVTDNNGCTATATMNVGEPLTGVSITTGSDSVNCAGGSDGRAWVVPSGGTLPYNYNWSTTPAQSTDTATGLGPGTYTVTVEDAGGCSVVSNPIDVFEPAPTAVVTDFDSVSCAGNADGRAWVIPPAGSVAPYSFSWNTTPVQNTDTATGLSPGLYDVVLNDGNGCTYQGSVNVVLKTPLALSGFSDSVTCGGSSNGRAWVQVTNGISPYTYTWSAGTPTASGDTITGVTAGSYTVTVTDAAGCIDSLTINVLQQANLNLLTGVDSASCFQVFDGRAWVSASGGAGGFTYEWSSVPAQFTDTMTGVRDGAYSVTVTDAAGCQDTANVFIGAPLEILTTTTSTDVTCNGAGDGTAYVTVTNAVGGFTCSWSGGTPTGPNGDTTTNLSAGTYFVTVTDGNGCTSLDSVLIGEPTAITLVNQVADSVSCFGGADGRIYVELTGGTPPYAYTWTGGTPVGAGDTVTGLTAGTYDLQVLDGNNCVFNLTGIVVDEPAALALSTVIDSVSCNGGSDGAIDLTVTGGTLPYAYSWNTSSISVNSEDISGLPAGGPISVDVVDGNGCLESLTGLTVGEPTALTLVMDAASASCNTAANGGAWVTPSGGVGPYTYAWNTNPVQNTDTAFGLSSGTYTVTVTDFNGCFEIDSVAVVLPPPITFAMDSDSVSCNGGTDGRAWVTAGGGAGGFSYEWNTTPVQFTDTATGLAAGAYTVTITDANFCTAVTSVTVEEPLPFTSSNTVQDVTCAGVNDGSISVTVSGGTGGYVYDWTDTSSNTYPTNTADLTNINGGSYTVVWTDANNCQDSIVNIAVAEADTLQLSSVADSVDCFGEATGSIDLTVTGGLANFQYSWSNNFAAQDPQSLVAGTYSVTVTDANGCTAELTDSIGEPTELVTSFTTTDVTCFGDTDGAIDLTVNGGVTPYNFAWSTNPTTEDLTGIGAGSYTVTVTDANGCTALEQFINITQPNELINSIALNTDSLSCDDNNLLNGLIEQTVTGGVVPYTFEWSNGETTQNASDLNDYGSFQVTVTDASGCTDTSEIVLNPYEAYAATIIVDSAGCFADSNGTARVSISGGLAPFSYTWNDGAFTQTGSRLDNLPAGDYTVEVSDALGCDTLIFFTVTEQPDMDVVLADSILLPFSVDSVLTPQIVGVRPVDSVIYTWEPEEGLSCTDCPEPIISQTRPFWYTLTMDVNGCVYTDSIFVDIEDEKRPVFVPNAFSPNGDGQNDFFQIYARGVRNVTWTVYNRWGGMVFQSRDINGRWDGTYNGKALTPAVFVVDALVIFEDGSSERFTQSLALLK